MLSRLQRGLTRLNIRFNIMANFFIEWDMDFEEILSLASRVINDGIGDDASFGEFSVLVDENYNKVQRDIHNQLVMDAFSDAVIEKATSTFA